MDQIRLYGRIADAAAVHCPKTALRFAVVCSYNHVGDSSMAQTALITGASSGIGKATALRLIKEGHTVYGAARRLEKMQDLVNAGGKAVAIDVMDYEQVHAEISKIIEREGR